MDYMVYIPDNRTLHNLVTLQSKFKDVSVGLKLAMAIFTVASGWHVIYLETLIVIFF
jgi:hypothetical protein